MTLKKLNTRKIRQHKIGSSLQPLQMLTCYDYQTATLLNETKLDMILVGDSLGNVILGLDTTIPVTTEIMTIFSAAVKRGAPNKFVIADMPFGSYASLEQGLTNAIELFQKSGVEALKLEGAFPHQLELIARLTETGIPVMGHIGLTPQSVHQQGGYYVHGKSEDGAKKLINDAILLEEAGVFSMVLECITPSLALEITHTINIPTIGIGSGTETDGQVLVINDLLQMGPEKPPKFCHPIANFYQEKKAYINQYLEEGGKYMESDELDEKHLYH